MPDDPLKNSRLKIEWANKKIDDLNTAIVMFLVDGGPCRFVPEPNNDPGDLVFRMRNVRVLPYDLSLITGDVLNALRSACDYLVRALVMASGNTPMRKCGFPIFADFDKYKTMKAGMIKGVSTSAETRIDALQPFNPGPCLNHPLWVLQELNNTDKHKLLIALAGHGGWGAMDFGIGPALRGQQISSSFSVKIGVPIEEGAEVLKIHGATAGVQMQPQFSIQIVLPKIGDAPNQPVIPSLQQLSGVVARVIDDFVVEFS